MTMNEIEALAEEYSKRRRYLHERIEQVQEELDAVKRRHHTMLRRRIDATTNARADLLAAVEDAADLFRKPRTRLLHGIKVGWRKKPGRIEVEDEGATITAIRRKLKEELAEELIQVREKLDRRGLRNLSARDLMRIGAVSVDSSDEPIAIPADSEIDKLVDALLEDAEEVEEEAAA